MSAPTVPALELTGAGEALPPSSEQHPLWLSIVLHLAPGAVMAAFVVLVSPRLAAAGIDPFLGLLLGITLVVVPLELGCLAVNARRRTGSWSPLAAVGYRTKLPLRRVALPVLGLAAWIIAVMSVFQTLLDERIANAVFAWMPEALLQFATVTDDGEAMSGVVLAGFAVLFFLSNGLLGPVTEELYFRGFLLPRIDRFGRGAPVLNTALFALYHFWTPWRFPAILLGFLPASWMAWRRRSLWISMGVHLVMNNVFVLMLLALYLGGA